MLILVAFLLLPAAATAQSSCAVAADPARQFSVGTSSSAGPFRWAVNGRTVAEGRSAQLLLLSAEGSAEDAGGRPPLAASGLAYVPGRWGQAFSLDQGGTLAYPREGSIDFNEGTVEMWAALRRDGDDPTYAQRDHYLFYYRAASGDTLQIALSRSAGIVYAGGTFRTLNGLVQPGLVQLVPSPRYVAPPPDPAPTQPPATAATVPAVPSVPERKRAPRAIDSPGVLGAVRIGQRLTCFVGNWSANPPVTRYTVQWLRNGRPIGGAEGLTYQLTPSDAGTELNCEVTADNRVGIVSATGIGVRVPAFVSVARFTGRRISLTRGRVARVRVFCAAQPGHACAGRLALTTRRLATIPRSSSPLLLGSASFRLEAHKSKVVSVRIGRRAALPARRNGVRAFVIVEQAISAGAPPRSDVATALLELPARRRGPQTGRR